MSTGKRRRIRPTHEWELLLPLFDWPEQARYEEIRSLVLFDVPVAERAAEIGLSESTLYRRVDRFAEEGMEGLFDAPTARRRRLPPAMRRLIVDLKAEHPAFNLNEIANVVRAAFGRKPDVRSVKRVLDETPLPLKIVRNYPPFHETEDPREARAAIRKLAQNPGLGAFRVHAALGQMGFDLSRATCGRILAQIREVYGYEKPEGGGEAPGRCPSPPPRGTRFGAPTSGTWTWSTRASWAPRRTP